MKLQALLACIRFSWRSVTSYTISDAMQWWLSVIFSWLKLVEISWIWVIYVIKKGLTGSAIILAESLLYHLLYHVHSKVCWKWYPWKWWSWQTDLGFTLYPKDEEPVSYSEFKETGGTQPNGIRPTAKERHVLLSNLYITTWSTNVVQK